MIVTHTLGCPLRDTADCDFNPIRPPACTCDFQARLAADDLLPTAASGKGPQPILAEMLGQWYGRQIARSVVYPQAHFLQARLHDQDLQGSILTTEKWPHLRLPA